MKTKRLFAIPIGVVILLALMALPASAAVVGKFTSLEGSVDITSTGKDARPAATGDPVAVGDFIRTKSKSRCEITYLDGNIIRLAEASRLRVTEYSLEKNNQKLDLLRGKVQSIVKTAAEVTGVAKGGRFEVHTPTAVAGVRGTNFFTYYQAGVSGATFKEGRGYGYSSNRPQDVRPISPGQTMVVSSPDVPPVVRPATSNELQRHEKDTAPAEKPKEKAEKEEDKAAPAAGQPAPQEEAKKPVTEEAPKIVYASRPADLQEQSKAVDIVARTEPVAASPTPAPAPPPPPPPPIDSTPPEITIIPQNPAAITNRTSAAFAVQTNETATISYSLNNSSFVALPAGDISLANIPEGSNTFTVKATDMTGNTATRSYSWTVDTIAPLITLSGTPAEFTKIKSADIGVTITDQNADTYAYTLNGSPVTSPTLANLSDGSYTFTVTARDKAGNISTVSSNPWTVDTIAPTVAISGMPRKVSGNDTATFAITALADTDTNPDKREYRLGSGDWQRYTDQAISNLSEGKITIHFRVIDLAANESAISAYEWFIGKRQYVLRDLQGGVTGGVAGDLSGAVKSSSEGIRVISTLPEGSSTGAWLLDLGGSYTSPPASSLTLVAGGKGYGPYYPENTVSIGPSTPPDGYWLSRIDGTAAQGTLTGTSNLSYLSPTTLGKGIGQVTGIYGSGNWQASGVGTYNETPLQFGSGEAHPLVYGGALAGDFSNWDFSGDNLLSQVPNSNATGLLGGTESLFLNPTQGVFASKPFIALGTYNPEATGSLFLSEIRGGGTIFGIGRFGLYVGGVRLPDTNIFRTQALGLYFRPTQNTYEAGVLASGAFDTHFYPNLAMWEMPLEPAKLQATMMNENFQGGEVEINEASIFGRVAGGGYLLGSAQALKNSQGVEYWGIFTAAFGGQGSLSSQAMGNLKMGGIIIPEGEDNPLAYWIGSASPALPQDGVGYFTGSLDGYFLGGTRGDFAGGSLLGMASDGSYQGILGGPYRENEMAFVAVANQSEAFFTAASSLQFSGHIHGFGGARTSPFSEASSLMLLGVYYNPDNYPLFRTTITGEDSNGFSFMSAVRGFALPEGNGAMVGKLIGPYLRQTGTTFELGVLLSGDVPIGAYAGINPLLLPGGGMWETDGGNLRGYPLATGLTSSQTPIVENWTGSGLNDPASFVTGFAGSLTLTFRDETSFNFAGQPWHLIASTIGGTYHVDNGSGPGVGTSLRWHANDAHTIVQLDTVNTIGDSKVFSGTLQGAVVDWQLAKTFVQGGEIRGLFDPATTWKAVYTGAWMETGAFLDMVSPMNEAQRAAFQEATKIPAIEVGKTTLAGTVNNLLSVTLRDVTFFRSSTGTNPLIWAVQGITGTTTGAPALGTAVPLNATSGGNITGSFTPHNWTSTQWGASVSGAGDLNVTGGGGATVPVNFTGGAVGVLSGTSFSGSGAGIVIPP